MPSSQSKVGVYVFTHVLDKCQNLITIGRRVLRSFDLYRTSPKVTWPIDHTRDSELCQLGEH